MNSRQFIRSTSKCLAAAIGLATVAYGTYAGVTWLRYGSASPANSEDADTLLDTFMPRYEIADRHHMRIAAPAETVLSAAFDVDFESSAVIRGIFKAREWILNSKDDDTSRPRGLLAQTKSLGWGILAEIPGREIVMGAVTKPWDANPVFRALPPDQFTAFDEPGYVKIVWTLRADPVEGRGSIFRTETRAIATDSEARRKFRRYWALLSPGIIVIRYAMLPAVKAEAERRCKEAAA
jgi:hypothetical protein